MKTTADSNQLFSLRAWPEQKICFRYAVVVAPVVVLKVSNMTPDHTLFLRSTYRPSMLLALCSAWTGTSQNASTSAYLYQGGSESVNLTSHATSKKRTFSATMCLSRYLDWAKAEHSASTRARETQEICHTAYTWRPLVLLMFCGLCRHFSGSELLVQFHYPSNGMGRIACPITHPWKASDLN